MFYDDYLIYCDRLLIFQKVSYFHFSIFHYPPLIFLILFLFVEKRDAYSFLIHLPFFYLLIFYSLILIHLFFSDNHHIHFYDFFVPLLIFYVSILNFLEHSYVSDNQK